MPHQRPCAQRIPQRRQPDFHSHRLTRRQFSRQHSPHSTLAQVHRTPRQGIWNPRAQHGHIHLFPHAIPQPPPPRRLIQPLCLCPCRHVKIPENNPPRSHRVTEKNNPKVFLCVSVPPW